MKTFSHYDARFPTEDKYLPLGGFYTPLFVEVSASKEINY